MTVTITPIFAGLLALFYVVLSFRVIGQRRSERISLGDGGDKELLRRLRSHGNFAEYAPFTLLLMLIAELQAAPAWILCALGTALAAGRLSHAYALGGKPQNMTLRVLGMMLTFAAITGAALTTLTLALIG